MNSPANAALFYVHEAFSTGMPKLMGRNAAGASFLAGYARHAGVERFLCYARSRAEFQHFEEQLGKRECVWIPFGNLQGLSDAGTLFVYGPGIGDQCWQRGFSAAPPWSVVGLTHTISSARVMEDFASLLTTPVEPWDALVCTSAAVKRTVQDAVERYGAWLAERCGGRAPALRAELPVIPLGVDCGAFPAGERREKLRAALRKKVQAGADDVVFLFVGRLSYHAKAHPLPMFLALEAAAKRARRKLTLLLAGYFYNESIGKQFVEAAKRFCPSVRVVVVEGRNAEARDAAWAAADVFTSLSDNIQESFGLAPVEAMAAGLPAVVSDWDGYRDTVLEGESGFRVPTAMPADAGAEIALRYLSDADDYDRYIGNVSQCTAVDVAATTQAYERLIADPALRRRMGEAGRERARRVFDWSAVVPAYQALWRELGERRRAAGAQRPRPPLRDDPFRLFAAFPSHRIGAASEVRLLAAQAMAEVERLAALPLNNFAGALLLGREELGRLFGALRADAPRAVRELEELFPPGRRDALLRTLGWLAKGGVVRVGAGALLAKD
jgi:glycosyltransferase involved in cell wall biosynthesis